MENHIKRKLRKLWRDRTLISLGSLLVFGFSALQVQSLLKNRPIHPSWVLEYSQSVETLKQESRSEEELNRAIKEILFISQVRNLQLTQALFQNLEVNQVLVLVQDPDLARARAWARVLELDQALAQILALNIVLELDQDLVLDLELDLAWALELDLAWALDRDLARARALAQEPDLSSELQSEVVQILNQANNNLLLLLIAAELEKTHGLTLQQGDILGNLLSREPNRARTLMQASILLGASTFVLLGLLAMLIRIKSPSNLPHTANLIVFLPEECVAELGYLQRRLKKANTSTWQIRRRLIHELVFLLWVHYVQMKIDNLFLGSGQDHTIDD